jgi:CHAT domain-containing protein
MKSEDGLKEGKALRQLQEAITFLEELQECQKRPTRNGNIDAQQLINGLIDPITEGLKELQIDLETKKDHGCNHDL